MKASEALRSNRAAFRRAVESHRACNARVFGSVLNGLDTDASDLDILVNPTPETTLMDVAAIQVELQRLLGESFLTSFSGSAVLQTTIQANSSRLASCTAPSRFSLRETLMSISQRK